MRDDPIPGPDPVDPAEPSPPAPVMVHARAGGCWFLLALYLALAALTAVAGGAFEGNPHVWPAVVCCLCTAAGIAWYLRQPLAVYDRAAGQMVHVFPFGLAWRAAPRSGGWLAVRGDCIVSTDRPGAVVLARAETRPRDWHRITDLVSRAHGRPTAGGGRCPRPAFVTRAHRRTGTVLAVLWLASLIGIALSLAATERAGPSVPQFPAGTAVSVFAAVDGGRA